MTCVDDLEIFQFSLDDRNDSPAAGEFVAHKFTFEGADGRV